MRTLVIALVLALSLTVSAAPRPLEYDRPIVTADLDGRTLRELILMRNSIFAHAGQPFRKQWLRDYFTKQSWYAPVEATKVRKVSALGASNAAAIATYEGALSKSELQRRRAALANGKHEGLTEDEAAIERTLIARALGGSSDAPAAPVVGAPAPAESGATPLDDPKQLDKLLAIDQLKDLSRRDLRVLRNMVYARRGRAFKSTLLQQYFDRMEWYSVDAGYSDKRLTKTDQRNIQIIRSVEDSIGGPMTDDEHKKEDGWLFAA